MVIRMVGIKRMWLLTNVAAVDSLALVYSVWEMLARFGDGCSFVR
jgi:hypothetical protein